MVHSEIGNMNQNFKIRPNFPKPNQAREVRRLSIKFNPSTEIFYGLGETFPNLETLSILYDTISIIKRRDFANMEQLRDLLLGSSPINFIAEDVFWDLIHLNDLTLSYTKIEKLPKNVFRKMRKLLELYLHNNQLTHLDRDLFANNLQLARIFLKDNKIKTINIDFTKLTQIEFLGLEGNICIDQEYKEATTPTLQQFQDTINRNCQGSAQHRW